MTKQMLEVIKNLPFEEYISNKDRISNHQLSQLAKTPATFHAHLTAPPVESSADQKEGSCFDLLMEAPDLFHEFVKRDDKRKTIAEEDNGNYLLGYERYDRLLIMAKNTREHPRLKNVLKDGDFQVSVFTTLEGVKVKSRPDFLPRNRPWIFDFKTTRVHPTPRAIRNEVTKFRYWQQAPFYLDQLPDREVFAFIFASKDPPDYLVTVDEAKPALLEHGRAEYRRLLELYKQCKETGIWPGYWDVRPLTLPKCVLEGKE